MKYEMSSAHAPQLDALMAAAMNDPRLVQVVRDYLTALHAGDCAALVRLFAPGGRVYSPFLGELPATEFYAILEKATERNVITPIDILGSANGARRVAAYFRFEWTVPNGSVPEDARISSSPLAGSFATIAPSRSVARPMKQSRPRCIVSE